MENNSFSREWLEPDGLGGFASGTASGIRTRRYQALLLTALRPPTGRMVLVNGFDAWIQIGETTYPLSSQMYPGGVVHPHGNSFIHTFSHDPWPRWEFKFPDGTRLIQEIFVPRGTPAVVLRWKRSAGKNAALTLRPFLSGRDYHALHHENSAFRFDAVERNDGRVLWRPYDGVSGTAAFFNGKYAPAPLWYKNFEYAEEKSRGLDFQEDLASPGVFQWDLTREALLAFGAEGEKTAALFPKGADSIPDIADEDLRRRKSFPSRLHKSADDYLVKRGEGTTIIAGYPWFTDWGRDTFISLRGLCLAGNRIEDARRILLEWAGAVSEGMLPNYFPDGDAAPEYNTMDASLWYIVAVHDFSASSKNMSAEETARLRRAVESILDGHVKGTRFGIRADEDGLLTGGAPGAALTWMDARWEGRSVTPRRGKPVEIQALWINALRAASEFSPRWKPLAEKAASAFDKKFWNAEGGFVFDVVDAEGIPGAVDKTFRPNQIFAVGGLPWSVLKGEKARRVVDIVENKLWTPLGLRSLAPDETGYVPRYEGGPKERDESYHQGAVWPWLMGPFVEAWLRVYGFHRREEARRKFLAPLLRHLGEAGLGHVSEIADAEPPHTPRGCPFQAWSVGELLRALSLVDNQRDPSEDFPDEGPDGSRSRLVSGPTPSNHFRSSASGAPSVWSSATDLGSSSSVIGRESSGPTTASKLYFNGDPHESPV